MKPVSPVIPGENHEETIIAEHQDEYQNLPSIRFADGSILTRWDLDEDEKKLVAETGSVYLLIQTFWQPVQPVLLMAEKPQIVPAVEVEESDRMDALKTTFDAFNLDPHRKPKVYGD